ALLLRNDVRYVGRTSWTGAHRRWLSELKLPEPAQQIVFEEYVLNKGGRGVKSPLDRLEQRRAEYRVH
ncbi:MAG TPA: hypothetical protein VIW78_13780, partial [Burkholderiales bacterium]